MSIGQCSLGYANKKIDQAVIKAIKNGSTSTLNSYEEVNLADKLLNIHKGLLQDLLRPGRSMQYSC